MKVGTKVLIVDNLKELRGAKHDIVWDMVEYAGKEAIITKILIENEKYELDIDGGAWTWYSNLINKIVE